MGGVAWGCQNSAPHPCWGWSPGWLWGHCACSYPIAWGYCHPVGWVLNPSPRVLQWRGSCEYIQGGEGSHPYLVSWTKNCYGVQPLLHLSDHTILMQLLLSVARDHDHVPSLKWSKSSLNLTCVLSSRITWVSVTALIKYYRPGSPPYIVKKIQELLSTTMLLRCWEVVHASSLATFWPDSSHQWTVPWSAIDDLVRTIILHQGSNTHSGYATRQNTG